MKANKFKLIVSIPAVIACILFGCERKEKVLLTELKSVEEETQSSSQDAEMPEKEGGSDLVVVHICGAVISPGVYELPAGSRVYQAVEAAGGFSEEARQDYLNQASVLQDGIRLYVPTMEETVQEAAPEEEGLVNINTAAEAELCTLTGIGSGKAKSIIAYRTQNGNFKTIEDIMNVEGIKDGLFQKIKDSITV